MALAVFNQFPQLTRFFAQLARAAAHKKTARQIVRLDLSTGRATLNDHAANLATRRRGNSAAPLRRKNSARSRSRGY